jgi:hypothetical protein
MNAKIPIDKQQYPKDGMNPLDCFLFWGIKVRVPFLSESLHPDTSISNLNPTSRQG